MNGTWVKIATGRYRLVYEDSVVIEPESAPFTVHTTNETPDGKFKYAEHGKKDHLMVEDMACEEGRKLWKDYVIMPDGREGPAPFRSSSERNEYLKMTGQRIKDRGECIRNPLEKLRERVERRRNA